MWLLENFTLLMWFLFVACVTFMLDGADLELWPAHRRHFELNIKMNPVAAEEVLL